MEIIKQEMIQYWSQRVESFSAQRCREFQSAKRDLWLTEFSAYIPMQKRLRILDIGTGTGFFATMLAMEGHDVVGIDLTAQMIAEAKRKAAKYRIPASFYVMDAEHPSLPPQSFDVLVSRNLTWTLPHLDAAYKAWHCLLKPGGLLLNFDADYCHEKENRILPENHAHKQIAPNLMQQYEVMKEELRQPYTRPAWDTNLLQQAGFSNIRVDTSVWKRIYADVDEFYNPTPIFTIVAEA